MIQELCELFDEPCKWTKEESYALDEDGFDVESTSYYASCWCLSGGLFRCFWFPYAYDSGAGKAIIKSILELYPDRAKPSPRDDDDDDWDTNPEAVVIRFNGHPDTTFADLRKVIEHATI